MLKNSDELFESESSQFSARISEPRAFCMNLFGFEPKLKTFQILQQQIKQTECVGDDLILDFYFESYASNVKFHLNPSIIVEMDTDTALESIQNFKVFALGTYPWFLSGTEQYSAVWQEVRQHWESLLVHEVVPEISNLTDFTQRSKLLKITKDKKFPASAPCLDAMKEIEEICEELVDAIAVVGMSCRFPGANNVDEFWELLISGRNPVRKIPAARLETFGGVSSDNKFQAGFLSCPINEFDAKFFGISPREAVFVDPQQRILLEVIWESLENACIDPDSLRGSNTSFFLGIWKQDYERFIPQSGLSGNDYHHAYIGNAFSATSSRISNFLGLYGPNHSIESGCSSSSAGIHLACQTLRRGDSRLSIASGVNLIMSHKGPMGGDYENSVVLSKDFKCKTFDEAADGYVRAEGCGAVVLKRLSDSILDGDNILGIIRGTALNNNGPTESYGAPSVIAQLKLARTALADARLSPKYVTLIETHGTGTAVGDPIEMEAIGHVFAEEREQPLIISSVKSNIGHSESCAGIASLIKVLLCFKHGRIPPNLHLQNLNPKINLESIPAIIPTEIKEWIATPRIAGLNSFGLSGTNVQLILQETPHVLKRREKITTVPPQPLHMIGISAKSEEALEDILQKYIGVDNSTQLGDIAFSVGAGRSHFSHRLALVAKDTNQLLAKLRTRDYIKGTSAIAKNEIVFLFTGHGSQYFGMGKHLYENSHIFRSIFDKCNALFERHLNIPLKHVVWKDASLLDNVIYSHAASFCFQFAILKLWFSVGIKPDVVLGHSLGEFGACVCAGIFSLEDAMKLVVARSSLIATLPPGRMMAIKTSPNRAEKIVQLFINNFPEWWVDVAAKNSNEEVVVSGTNESIEGFGRFCSEQNIITKLLDSHHAFHSRETDMILTEFGQIASKVSSKKSKCTYISGTTGRNMDVEDFTVEYWQNHLRNTVNFQGALSAIFAKPETAKKFVEIGTQPVLLGFAMADAPACLSATFCPSLRKNMEDLSMFLNSTAKLYASGVNLDWGKWYVGAHKSSSLPTYPFRRLKYWFVPDALTVTPITPVLNPLLGWKIPSPASIQLFTQHLSLKDLPYLGDHQILERVIFPAAGYLEIMMAAEFYRQQQERLTGFSIQVENLQIDAAMELKTTTQIQTLIIPFDDLGSGKMKIEIYSYVLLNDGHDWKRHAIGTCSPVLNSASSGRIDLKRQLSSLTQLDTASLAYTRIRKLGYQFGAKFQSILAVWEGNHELFTKVKIPEDSLEYICHPIIIDAMLQSFAVRLAFCVEDFKIHLQLPMSVKLFKWFLQDVTQTVFIHSKWDRMGESSRVTLYSENGSVLALMEGVELAYTNAERLLQSLDVDKSLHYSFVEERWKLDKEVGDTCVVINSFQAGASTSTSKTLQIISATADLVSKTLELANDLLFTYFVSAVSRCNWPWPKVGAYFDSNTWSAYAPPSLLIFKSDAVMTLFEFEGYLKGECQDKFVVLKKLHALDEIEAEIEAKRKMYTSLVGVEDILLRFIQRWGECLPAILEGKMKPLEALFPKEEEHIGALRLYSEATHLRHLNELITSLMLDAIVRSPQQEIPTGILQILEVGAGSGCSCNLTSTALTKLNTPFQYTFSDISPKFLTKTKETSHANIIFKLLDIERDPLTQGFSPGRFDVIVASNVIHATAEIVETLKNIYLLLRPGGILIISEIFKESPYLSLSFGFLEGWWRMRDFRRGSPLISEQSWIDCLSLAGFIQTKSFTIHDTYGAVIGRKDTNDRGFGLEPVQPSETSKSKFWHIESDSSQLASLITQRIINAGRIVSNTFPEHFSKTLEGIIFFWTVNDNILMGNQTKCNHLLHLCQDLIRTFEEASQKPKLFLITRGVEYIGNSSPGNPNSATAHALLKSFCNENPDFRVCIIDADQDNINVDKEAEFIFDQLWSNDKELFKAIRGDKIFNKRLVPADKKPTTTQFPNATHFKLMSPFTKTLKDLEFSVVPPTELVGDMVEVMVRAAALNFRDIFMILQPEGFRNGKNMDTNPGFDVAGVVSKIGPKSTKFKPGDEVFGFISGGGLATFVAMQEGYLIRKPASMTFPSAATISLAFLTAYNALVVSAKLQTSDRVLIHAATGGVGLAAIQVAKHVGANIFATAGSRRKRTYLKGIGIRNVYSSRNTKFGDKILTDSDGAGVTVILNSLTSANYKETSLKACAQKARFIELGLVNIFTHEELNAMRPDIAYFYGLLPLIEEKPQEIAKLTELLELKFRDGTFAALPHNAFPLDNIQRAFKFFADANHVGKVVINMPVNIGSQDGRQHFKQHLFYPESTYIITGGLGGLGMEVVKWMLEKGAQNLILTGRNPPTATNVAIISNFNQNGCRIIVIQSDVGDYDECARLFDCTRRNGMPPIRGILHAAGVLCDAVIRNQSWKSFEETFRAKVQGTWNLHSCTLGCELEFFAMFSSIAACLGPPGQSNHAAANQFMDSFANYRNSLGLTATTINFGPWADIGKAAATPLAGYHHAGFTEIPPKQGLAAIESVFRRRLLQAGIVNVKRWTTVKQALNFCSYFDDILEKPKLEMNEYPTPTCGKILQLSETQQLSNFEIILETNVKRILRIDNTDIFSKQQNLFDAGLDSLMAIELRNSLRSVMGAKQLTLGAIQFHGNVENLAAHMVKVLNRDVNESIPTPKLVEQDSILPADIKATSSTSSEPSRFQNVLLTGTTGHLGVHFIASMQKHHPHIRLHCVVRGKSIDESRSRLQQTLKLYSLFDKIDFKNISVVQGDLVKKNFGLAVDTYDSLAANIDAIIHCAAMVNHIEDYAAIGEETVRFQNLNMTLNVLRFAGKIKTKHVLHASSFVAVMNTDADCMPLDEFPVSSLESKTLENGYMLSKFVSELLMSQAMERGIPVTNFRYPMLLGHALTGHFPLKNDHHWNIILACMESGMFADVLQNLLSVMAVDTAAEISTKIFMCDTSEIGVYNLSSVAILYEDAKEVFKKSGVDLEYVPYQTWRARIFEHGQANKLNSFHKLYEDSGIDMPVILARHPFLQKREKKLNILSEKTKKNYSEVESCIVKSRTLLQRHLLWYFEQLDQRK